VPKTKFITITVLEDYGVLVGICGRHRHIRMYGLETLTEKQTHTKFRAKKDPYIKIRETKGCFHYSIVHTRGTAFMVAGVRKQIILFMWADYPFNKFMKIKDFYVPENARRVEPILTDGKITQLAVQVSTRFLIIDVETNDPTEIPFPNGRRMAPLFLHKCDEKKLFLTYSKGGHFVNGKNLEPIGKFVPWRFLPAAVGEFLTFRNTHTHPPISLTQPPFFSTPEQFQLEKIR